MGFAFPTLKRGANNLCAYGAVTATSLPYECAMEAESLNPDT
jgi:hypothetical protein